MKALNKQERTTAIFKFSLWLLLGVVIICVPIIITSFSSREQQKINTGEKDAMMKVANFEKDTIADKVQKIVDLLTQRDAQQIDPDVFNAQLMIILSDISQQSSADTSWRGVMYGNIANISKYLVQANKIVTSSGSNKDQQAKDLGNIIIELGQLHRNLNELIKEKKKRDITSGLDEVAGQLNVEIQKLNNFKSGL